MFRLRAAAGALLVLMLLVGLQASALAQGGRIAGRVLDAETGDPIVGADISLQAPDAPLRTLRTDADGRFSLDGLSSGPWQVHVRAEGYNDDRQSRRRRRARPAARVPPRSGQASRRRGSRRAGCRRARSRADRGAARGGRRRVQQGGLGRRDRGLLVRSRQASRARPSRFAPRPRLPRPRRLSAGAARVRDGAGRRPRQRGCPRRHCAGPSWRSRISPRRSASSPPRPRAARRAARISTTWRARVRAGRRRRGRRVVREGGRRRSGWAKPVFKLGLVALNRGDFDLAKAHFRRVVELDPASDEGAQASATLAVLP